jgi:hypothetical protein
MSEMADDEHGEWVRRLRDQSRRDAEELVPRPDYPVYGLAAPLLRPVALMESARHNGVWTSVSVRYGSWDEAAGPHVNVASAAPDATPILAPFSRLGRGTEAELLRAIDAERDRIASFTGLDDEEPAEPPSYSRERLPVGDAIVCRHGTFWAVRLIDGVSRGATAGSVPPAATVTITGHGTEPQAVRLEPVTDLAPLFQARNEMIEHRRQRRHEAPPPVLEPAEGIAALRALTDTTLAVHERIRKATRSGRMPRTSDSLARRRGALWQRAVREQRRLAGIDAQKADAAVTSVVNHLGHLLEQAPWFSTDERLREAAIDETLRHSMLGARGPSGPAQDAWARYWSAHTAWLGKDPESPGRFALVRPQDALSADWLRAWASWAEARGRSE